MDALDEYTHHTPDGEHDAVPELDMDMDMAHDFGEGVGIDMRDFTSHADEEAKEGMTGEFDTAPLRLDGLRWTMMLTFLPQS
jgi:hypothetical protein